MRALGLLLPQRRRPRRRHNGRIRAERPQPGLGDRPDQDPTREGWLWKVAVIDCHDRDLIGHHYSTTANTKACLAALHAAVLERFAGDLDALQRPASASATTGAPSSPAATTNASSRSSRSATGRP